MATRRDLDDDATIHLVADAAGSLRTLRLLHALTEADSLATGPAAWNSWKAGLVAELVDRAAHVLGGGAVEEVTTTDFPSDAHLRRMAEKRRQAGATEAEPAPPTELELLSEIRDLLSKRDAAS